MLDQILSTAEDIVVLGPGKGDRFRVAIPFKGDFSKSVYNEVRKMVDIDFKNVPAFGSNVYFGFNESTGEINGLSTFYGILVNQVLREEGLWLPTVFEGKELEGKGKLTNGVYRNYGIAVYSNSEPNQKVAEKMINKAKIRGWNLPILASSKALRIKKGRDLSGVDVTIDNDCGIISGDEARQYIQDNLYEGDSGACGVERDRYGLWGAFWYGLDDSYDNGRVDFVCSEAARENLEGTVLADIDKVFQMELDKINERK